MSRPCPSCGEPELPGRSRYCLSCGQLLVDAPAEPAAPAGPDLPYTPAHLERDVLGSRFAREGERKQVTLLFADVAGSLAMASALDPEDVHEIMNGLFALALDAVHAEQGTINQFRGDGFMALFGAPRAHGEDASRALRAALRIRDESVRYGRSVQARFGIPLALRQGLHTGTVWVGSIGKDRRLDYTAEGVAVGTAARIEQAATPGQILVSEETAHRVSPYFDLTPLGVRTLRGLDDPVRVFEVTGVGRHERRLDAELARGLTPFVGRDAELRWLERATSDTQRASHFRVAVVLGEAGIGKSRLVLEHLSRESTRVTALEARCRPAQRSRAHGAWLEIARGWPRRLPGDEEAHALEKALRGDEEQESPSPSALAERFCELLAGAASRQPLVLVFEDAQWMDPSSIALLERLISDPPEAPVLALVTARAEASSGDPGEGPAAWGETLRLEPLEREGCESLARAILADLGDAESLASVAVARGGGNPLFVEELARSLRDGPPELREAARLEAALARQPVRVPETLQDVIASRIDALSDDEKRLAQTASVIGRPFREDLLVELETEAGPTLRSDVHALLDRGIWVRDAEGLEFRHGLVREVAYAQLLRAQRRALHRRCADALAREPLAASAAGASEIGHHFDQAGDNERAAAALGRAGKAYLSMSVVPEAAAHLKRAWELLTHEVAADPESLGSVGLALATAFNRLDRSGDALEVLRAISSLPLGARDRGKAAQACIEHGWVAFSERNDLAGSRDLIARGLAMLRGVEDAWRIEASAHTYLSRIEGQDGEMLRAGASAERVIELARLHGDPAMHAYGLCTRGCVLCDSGEIQAALESCLEARELAEQIGSDVLIGLASCWLAKVHVCQGRPDLAIAEADAAARLGESSGQVGLLYSSRGWSASAHLLAGAPERALEVLETLGGLNQRWPSDLETRARALVDLGRLDEAETLARECLDQAPPRLIRVRALCTLGRALGLASREPVAAAETALHHAVTISSELGMRPHLADAHQAFARVYRHWGALESARMHARLARDAYAKCGMELHASLARTLLAEI
jgi:class 3 adenylate cyclase/tetratricopeptide (TPR) repeat protein